MKLSGHMTRAAFSSRKMKFEKKSADACLTVSHWINISSHVYTVDVDLDVFFMTAHHWVSVLLDVHLIPAVSPTSRGARARVIYTLPTQYSKCMCKTGRIFFSILWNLIVYLKVLWQNKNTQINCIDPALPIVIWGFFSNSMRVTWWFIIEW